MAEILSHALIIPLIALNRAGLSPMAVAWLFTVRFFWPRRTKIKSLSKDGILGGGITGAAVPG